MKPLPSVRRSAHLLGVLCLLSKPILAQTTNTPALLPGQAVVLAVEGRVEFSRKETQPPVWDRAYTGQIFKPGDSLKVAERSRLHLRFSNQSIAWFSEKTDFALEAPVDPKAQSSILLFLGR